jgi:hypothetical protein
VPELLTPDRHRKAGGAQVSDRRNYQSDGPRAVIGENLGTLGQDKFPTVLNDIMPVMEVRAVRPHEYPREGIFPFWGRQTLAAGGAGNNASTALILDASAPSNARLVVDMYFNDQAGSDVQVTSGDQGAIQAVLGAGAGGEGPFSRDASILPGGLRALSSILVTRKGQTVGVPFATFAILVMPRALGPQPVPWMVLTPGQGIVWMAATANQPVGISYAGYVTKVIEPR